MRKAMVEKDHPQLSVRTQCELLNVNRNRLEPKKPSPWKARPEQVEIVELIKIIHAKDPTMGSRQRLHGYAMDGGSDDEVPEHQSNLSQASHDGARARKREVSLSTARLAHLSPKPSVSHRYYLHPVGAWLRVFDGNHRLAHADDLGVARVEHYEGRFLSRRSVSGDRVRRDGSRDPQHGPGRPIHGSRMAKRGRRVGSEGEYGWSGALAGQRHY